MPIDLASIQTNLEEIKKEKARRGLLPFTIYTFDGYEVNWHHEVTCEYLDEWAFGDVDRLMVFEPPRHGKSELVSRRLPAYIFGRNPDARIIGTSFGDDLAQRMNRDVQRIMDSESYTKIFPDTTLAGKEVSRIFGTKALRNTNIFEIVGHKGVYTGSGIGGAIMGMGFDYGIIDDPYKNRQEANSRAIREKVWEWFTEVFYTRGEKGAKMLLTMTRWHESDLAGMLQFLMANDPEADKWTILVLPAFAEYDDEYRKEGEALWPSKYGVADLMATKATLGSYAFNALYQQRPSPVAGGILLRDWWKYYRDPPGKFDLIIQSWDMTFKGKEDSDYVVGGVLGKVGSDIYVLDLVRGKMTFSETIRAFRELSAKWPKAVTKLIEDKANGPAIIDVLKHEVPGIIPVNPRGSKIERANAASPIVEAGNVFLPIRKPWVQDFVEECAAFPNGAYDDQVDMFTQAMARFSKRSGMKTISKRILGM